MFVYIIITLFLLLFVIQYGNKKGFNKLETYWIIYTLLFYILLFNLRPIQRIFLIIMVVQFKFLRIPICTVTGILLVILGQKFKTYRILCLGLYKLGLNLKMNIENIPSNPTIYLANYPCNYIEYLVHGLFCDKFCLVVYGPAIKVLKHIYGEEHLIAVEKGHFDKVQNEIESKIKDGYSIFSYIERDYYNRKGDFELCDLRTGMFSIAKNIDVNITPVCIDHIDHFYGITDGSVFKIKIGDTFKVTDPIKALNITKEFLSKELKRI